MTHDARIRYRPNELAAVENNRAPLLVIIGHAPYAELARAFVATRSLIERFVAENRPPYIAKVYRPQAHDLAKDPDSPGRIELWYPKSL